MNSLSKINTIPNDCTRVISSFLYPSKALFADLNRLNGAIVADRIRYAFDSSNRIWQRSMSYRTTDTNLQYQTENDINTALRTHKLDNASLYDILGNYEKIKMLGWGGSANLWELRSYLQKELFRKHRTSMYCVHRHICARRVPATHCGGGCIQCDAELPVWWPSVKEQTNAVRQAWRKKTDGYYRIGFCSSQCIGAYNASLNYRSRREAARYEDDRASPNCLPLDESGNFVMKKEDMYICESKCCKEKVHWTDLERHCGRVFCSDQCEDWQIEDEYEEDLMYRKYDSRW
jgi:hypothetical protein